MKKEGQVQGSAGCPCRARALALQHPSPSDVDHSRKKIVLPQECPKGDTCQRTLLLPSLSRTILSSWLMLPAETPRV